MIRYLIFLPLSIAMTLVAVLLAPLLAVIAGNDGWLPKWLWWFQTPDNSCYGDNGHEERWNYTHSYSQKVAWLLRNPAYGFEWEGPLAANISSNISLVVEGDPWIKNRDNAKEGSYFCIVGPYWNYKLIKHLFGDTAYMLEFGWKLQGFAQKRETSGRAMYVFSIRLTAFR